ncbi:hypothetical protein [Ramlibacter sp.]|uniref:hypothetical protein n=1 Tax=Ramlibacter sp. TaxID=1917967 RepID=UPI003D0CE344
MAYPTLRAFALPRILHVAVALSAAVLATAVAAAVIGLDAPVAQVPGQPGERIYQRDSVTWRLQDGECRNDILVDALAEEGKEGDHKAAVMEQGGRKWAACWAYDIDSDVIVVDLSGGRGFMPYEWFVER